MPIDLHGKAYYTVAERLKLAYGEDFVAPTKVQRIETELCGVGNVACVRATITFEDGRTFTGMSMLNLQATSPAERNAPLETCETSAVGRALAFAGFHGSPEGIAGYEEILLAQEREKARGSAAVQAPAAPRPAPTYADGSGPYTRTTSGLAPRPVGNPGGPSPAQVRFANKLWADAGNAMPPPDWESMSSADVSRKIDELKAGAGR